MCDKLLVLVPVHCYSVCRQWRTRLFCVETVQLLHWWRECLLVDLKNQLSACSRVNIVEQIIQERVLFFFLMVRHSLCWVCVYDILRRFIVTKFSKTCGKGWWMKNEVLHLYVLNLVFLSVNILRFPNVLC